jgi:NAD(P)-dependent dehydrogenase (short-subunit alcohol dehydrogenase family)
LWVGELDLSDLANIPKVFSAAVEQRGRVHAVVNNAAYILMGAAEELELDAIRHNCGYQAHRLDPTGTRGGGAYASSRRRTHPPDTSSAGQSAFPGVSLYCSTKWSIEGFFEALSQEVSGFGIGATLVEPGAIRTDFGTSGAFSPELDAYRLVDTFEAELAPPRLALGPDPYGHIKTALYNSDRAAETFKDLTMSTNCDDAG